MKFGIIYVSSNQEDPEFERKTREDLIEKSGGLPIVGVTQKAVDLGPNGKNIVVGEVGASGFNFCRQVQIACQNSDADMVYSAESDCLYSPDYFEFKPKRVDIPYRNTNIYVQHFGNKHFFKKEMSTFSQVVGRKFYLERFDKLFVDQSQWDMSKKNFPKEIRMPLFEEFETFETKYPCISFKTGKGMRHYTKTDRIPRTELPYWGKTEDIINEYLGGN